MTYDQYAAKVRRRADRIFAFTAWLKKHRAALCCAFLLAAAAAAALMAFSGSFLSAPVSGTAVYGENYESGADAFLCGVTYEYYDENGAAVSELKAGEYTVYARTKNVFGTERERSFTLNIAPRSAELSIESAVFEYGESPAAGDLTLIGAAEGDRVAYAGFSYGEEPGEYDAAITALRIENAAGEDVTYCYDIKTASLRIQIVPRELTVTFDSAEKTYDSLPLVSPGYTLNRPLAFSDELYMAPLSVTEAGAFANTGDVAVFSGEKDVTGRYVINLVPGTLTVKKRPLAVTTASFSAEFDGTVREEPREYAIAEGTLVGGHTLDVEWEYFFWAAGKYRNAARFTVTDGSGADVTHNYDIEVRAGDVEIEKRKLKVKSVDAQFEYDSEIHFFPEYSVVGGSLAEGHRILEASFGYFIDAGEYQNGFWLGIGADPLMPEGSVYTDGVTPISECYDIEYVYGGVTVTKRPLTLEVHVYKYEADAGEYRCLFRDIQKRVAANDALENESGVKGTTLEDIKKNIAATIRRNDDYNSNVTFCYDIEYVFPDLTQQALDQMMEEGIAQKDPEPDKEIVEPGTPTGVLSPPGKPEQKTLGYVKSVSSGRILLRIKSFGEYSGEWEEAEPYYGAVFDSMYSRLINQGYHSSNEIEVTFFSAPEYLAVPYYSHIGGRYYDTAAKNGRGASAVYRNIPPPALKTLYAISQGLGGADDYTGFVNEQYLRIDPALKQDLLALAKQAGVSGEGAGLIEAIAEYVKSAAEYSYDFPETPANEDPVMFFLTKSKLGVCSQFASAATLMYRAFGIPARYTTGISVSTAGSRKLTEFYTTDLHAWVEIYLPGLGWAPVDVTPGYAGASGPGGNNYMHYDMIHIIPRSVSVVFDGEPHSVTEYTVLGEELLKAGDRIICKSELSEHIFVGYYPLDEQKMFRIVDKNGKDVTAKYNIDIKQAYLEITPLEITADPLMIYVGGTGRFADPASVLPPEIAEKIDLSSAKTVYDKSSVSEGLKPLEGGVYAGVYADHSELVCSYELGIDSYSHAAGFYEIRITFPADVVAYENVRFHSGSPGAEAYGAPAAVTGENGATFRRAVFMTSSAEKPFDGEYLTSQGISLIGGALAEGHRAECAFLGAQLYSGSAENTVSGFRIVDENGGDVTSEYMADIYFGTLTVVPAEYPLGNIEVTVQADQTVSLSGFLSTDRVDDIGGTFTLDGDALSARIEDGDLLIGVNAGKASLIAVTEGADLNGDGVLEYVPTVVKGTVEVTAKKTRLPKAALYIIIFACVVEGVGAALLALPRRKRASE
ncbi:MAG: transglutaminase domain-containing protein [Clostridia bacterium]|nr:transglutaminase domain-containing protein [Clostridia bacterium]